jgi:hypothetical protein
MNKQKVISSLQSRIAKRKNIINAYWRVYKELTESASFVLMKEAKSMAILLGNEQKLDKSVMSMLNSPFHLGYKMGFQDACNASKQILEACECQH